RGGGDAARRCRLGRLTRTRARPRRPRGAARRPGSFGEEEMTRSLVPTTEHLRAQRRTIAAHAVAAGIAGLVPLPFLDDALPALVKRAMLRRIALFRNVDVDEDALRVLAAEPSGPPGLGSLVGLGSLIRGLRRSLRTA